MTFRTFVRPLFVALSLAFATTAAAPAFAESSDAKVAAPKDKGHKKGDRKHDHKHDKKGDKPQFPVKADGFAKMVDTRLSDAKTKLESGLARHKVEGDAKAAVLKDFDTGAALVRAAAKRVGKDGEVTKDEAKEVRQLVKSLRKDMRTKFAPKKAHKPAGKDV